ncbi:MAG: hypothetical protein ACE5HO_16720 [bacterium]
MVNIRRAGAICLALLLYLVVSAQAQETTKPEATLAELKAQVGELQKKLRAFDSMQEAGSQALHAGASETHPEAENPGAGTLAKALSEEIAVLKAHIAELRRQVETLQQKQGENSELKEQIEALEQEFRQEQEFASRVLVGGYAQVVLEDPHDRGGQEFDSNFSIRRVIFFIGGQVTKRVRFASEIEFEFGGTPFKTEQFSDTEPGEVRLEQAYIEYLITEAINFRGGVILAPLLRFNLLHDPPLRKLSTRPMVDKQIVPTTWFPTGVGFFGTFFPVAGLETYYEVYVINGLDDNILDGPGLSQAKGRSGVPRDNNNDKALVGRLAFIPAIGLDIGFSGYTGDYDPSGKRRLNIYGLDLTYRRGPFELLFEGVRADLDDGLSNAKDREGNPIPVPHRMEGFFVQGSYDFWPGFLSNTFLGKGFESPTFSVIARYGEVDTNDDFVSVLGDRQRLTLGFNYRPSESTVFKIEYLFDLDDREGPARDEGFVFELSTYF